MKKTIGFSLMALMLLFTLITNGQDTALFKKPAKLDIGLEGMLGVSFGKDFYAFNVGGPALFLVLNSDLKIGVGALPSLYVLQGKLGARLGVAPRVDYKNWVFFAPFYHRDRTEEWIWSVGFGYKFHKKKSN